MYILPIIYRHLSQVICKVHLPVINRHYKVRCLVNR